MSGVYESAVTARARLACDARACGQRWVSDLYYTAGGGGAESHIHPALNAGWRIFVGGRSQHTYCPEHGPKVTMRLIHGTVQP